MRIKRREADGSRSENRRIKVERTLRRGRVEQSGRRIEIVKLLRFREDKRNVVALVAPSVEVHGREENAVCRVEHDAHIAEMVRDPEARSKIVLVRIHQAVRESVLSADKNMGRTVLKDDVGVGVTDVVQRARIFIAQAHFDRGVVG